MTKVVDLAVYQTIKSVLDGTFKGGRSVLFDLKSRGIDYVYDQNNKDLITDNIHQEVEKIRNKIISGEISVPRE